MAEATTSVNLLKCETKLKCIQGDNSQLFPNFILTSLQNTYDKLTGFARYICDALHLDYQRQLQLKCTCLANIARKE